MPVALGVIVLGSRTYARSSLETLLQVPSWNLRPQGRRLLPPTCLKQAGPVLEGARHHYHRLTGVFRLSNEDYFIEPLEGVPARPGHAQPHVVYKRQAPERGAELGGSRAPGTCGVPASTEPEARRERWEQRQQWRRQRPRRLHQRSVSREKWVETLVVADTKMVEYHGQPQVESYVLTIMNMVAGLFHDPSIGNPIHITIVRLVLLEDEEEDLKVTHHADNTLRSFCKWQKSINMKGDAHPLHHDTAILLTRKDLCAAMNRPCETLGLSHVAGMCQPHRSCNINEDTGLPLAFTVAHELGHSFGIQHDGSGNDCEPVGKRPSIMSPQLLYDTAPLTWSRCSREYITRFLDFQSAGRYLDEVDASVTLGQILWFTLFRKWSPPSAGGYTGLGAGVGSEVSCPQSCWRSSLHGSLGP
ncbi:A disintegrin and metalloproteinase with thrombospondin motifs 7 [Puma concolor]|uniref:A disintegrin and metalloproteinase with thrombospondin motifs 7 n=1 Tax=Puma concolor TaxID=9696 RepID=A0A6P6HG38_PUMCO|nr:A disintegrin and metalloproteinase with thrombospondin motifs 7 [Puma concolor]